MHLTYRLDIGKSISKGIFALIFLSSFSAYGAWPEKPIKIIVPYIPGGAADSAIRAMAPGLQKRLEQPIVIENKAGAGATMGTAAVASSPADGYTLLVGSASNAIGNAIQAKIPYVFERDFIPVMLIADVPGVVVVPSKLPIKNIQELVAYAKSHPGEMNYGSPGYSKGTPPDAIQALTKDIEDTLKDEEIKRVLFKLGIEAMPGSASVLRERVSSDSRRWEKVIKNRKMELQ